jgi:hypothetical protein
LIIDAEKILFSLKEVLTNESQTSSELMLQVYWGLLACEILNGKGRDVVENTTVKKMRDLIEKRFTEGGINDQQYTQYMSWLLHWLLVYCFTQKESTNTCLFATLLSDTATHGSTFLAVVQMRTQFLLRYMVASFILARGQQNQKYQINRDALERIALPISLDFLQSGSSDVFAQFLQSIYEDFDLDRAAELAN